MRTLSVYQSILKTKLYKNLLSVSICFCLLSTVSKATDFSNAQQTYVPPTLIQRGLNAIGGSNWNLPGWNSPVSNSDSSLTSIFSSISPSPNEIINGGNASAPSTWDTLQTMGGGLKNIPGLSKYVGKIQSKVSSLTQSGNFPAAENLARAGLKYFPNNSVLKGQFASVTATEAQAFLKTKNYDAAGKKAREALVADPNNKKAKIVIGKVLQAQGLNPSLAESHVAAGDNLIANGRVLEASVEYKLANDIKANSGASVGLGNIALSKGQVAQAGQYFEQALSIDPNYAVAYRQRGALRYLLGDPVGANTDLGKAVSLNPNDKLASQALIGLWKQQVSLNPNSANSHLGLARAYLQTHDLEDSRNEYKQVVALDPNNPSLPAARASFKIALARQEANQCMQAAKTLESQGALNEAHKKMLEAIAYCPDDPQVLFYNGQICEKLGLSSDAHDAYMSVLKFEPNNVPAAAAIKRLGYSLSAPAVATQGVLAPEMTAQGNMPPVAPLRESIVRKQILNVSNSANTNIPMTVPPLNTSTGNDLASPASNSTMPSPSPSAAPLKSPLPANTQSSMPLGYAYYDAVDNVYIGQPAQVTMLGNFGSCVRALIMAERMLLAQPPRGKWANNYKNKQNVSAEPENSF